MKRFLFVSLVLMATCTGCALPDSGGGAADELRKFPPKEIIRRVTKTRASLKGMRATATMRITDKPNKFSLGINADIIALHPGKLRIKADKVGGQIKVFDCVVAGSDIWFYVPRKRTLYEGKAEDLDKVEVNFRPDDILRYLLRPERNLIRRNWKLLPEKKRGFFGRSSEIVLEEIAASGLSRQRLHIDGGNENITRIETINGRGEVVLIKKMERYGPPASLDIKNYKAYTRYKYPWQLILLWPKEDRSVTVNFKSLYPLASVDDDEWLLEVPSRTRKKHISKIEVEGDNENEAPVPEKPDK